MSWEPPSKCGRYAAMQHGIADPTGQLEQLGRAIIGRRIVSAVYNGTSISLQPYILFVRNDAFYLGAFNPGKNRRHDEGFSLGLYNISGFSELALGAEFSPLPGMPVAAPRDSDRVILSISP